MDKFSYNRRDFLKSGIAGLAGLSAAGSLLSTLQAVPVANAAKKGENQPNIILFFTDQQRLSAIGAYGKTVCKTPNIDRLAAEGVRFENAYTACPLCSPARASVMTGQHIHTHRVGANIGEYGCNNNQLPDSPDLLSRRLQAAGYSCGYTGKWHLGDWPHGLKGSAMAKDYAMPSTRGFIGQDFSGHGDGGFGYDEYKQYLKKNGFEHKVRPHKKDGLTIRRYGILEGPVESTVPYFLANNTISMIDQFIQGRQPFFIWHNNWGPHEPYYVPEKYYNMYKDVKIPQWENYNWRPQNPHGPDQLKRHPNVDKLQWEDWEESIRHYYAFATLIDEQIGRVLDHMEKKGIADNTIIIFSSDHGETLGSHGGLVDKGWTHYEEMQRIGLIVKNPRKPNENKSGKVRTELASSLDLYPTILDYAKADYGKKKIHGRSLVDLVEGKTTEWRDCVFVEFFGLGSMATNMVTCRWKNIKYGYTCSNKDELYDLEKDPYEMTNLLDDPAYAQTAEMMKRRIYTFMARTGYPGIGNFVGCRLGYSSERQYIYGPDPVNINSFLVDNMKL